MTADFSSIRKSQASTDLLCRTSKTHGEMATYTIPITVFAIVLNAARSTTLINHTFCEILPFTIFTLAIPGCLQIINIVLPFLSECDLTCSWQNTGGMSQLIRHSRDCAIKVLGWRRFPRLLWHSKSWPKVSCSTRVSRVTHGKQDDWIAGEMKGEPWNWLYYYLLSIIINTWIGPY